MPETLRIEFLLALAAACAALSAFASSARARGNADAAAGAETPPHPAIAGCGANFAALSDSEQSPPDLAEAGGHSEAASFLANYPGE